MPKTKLKPRKADVSLCYTCPECGSEWWHTQQQVYFGSVLSCCGKDYEIQPVLGVKVIPSYKVKKPHEAKELEKPVPKIDIQKKTLDILKGLGYNVQEAKHKICEAQARGEYSTAEDLFQAIMVEEGV